MGFASKTIVIGQFQFFLADLAVVSQGYLHSRYYGFQLLALFVFGLQEVALTLLRLVVLEQFRLQIRIILQPA